MIKNKKGKKQVSLFEKLIFASADFFGGGGQSLISVVYLIFLTNIVGIRPAWAGMVVMVSKLWDAISDPLMGVISDNTRFKMGRRKPFIFAGGFLLILVMALLWLPTSFKSETFAIIYVTITYILYSTISTVISVPYSSLSTEISTNYEETNKVNVMRLIFSLISTAICTLVPASIFKMLTNGEITISTFYITIVFGFGLFFAVPLILTGLICKERVALPKTRTKFSFKQFAIPLKVKSFRKLLGLYLCQSINLDILSAIILYFSLYVIVGLNETIFLASFLVVQLVMLPIISKFVSKVSKTKLYRFGLPLSILCAIVIGVFPSNGPIIVVYLATALMAIGFAGAQTMSWIMFPDVVDIAHLGLGDRIAGSLSGAMTFIRKAASAIAIFIIGLVLELTGFIEPTEAVKIPTQPASTILGLRLIFILSWVVLMGIAFYIARKFKLSPELSKRVKVFIGKRDTKGLKSFEEDERKQYDNIVKEFV